MRSSGPAGSAARPPLSNAKQIPYRATDYVATKSGIHVEDEMRLELQYNSTEKSWREEWADRSYGGGTASQGIRANENVEQRDRAT
ncbi:hypothetical protein Syun_000359 [Stephania yunnanensis]|uniref:Uncharacterized protein n=1 Tax=Stephania yunnanensis TaxID=152371 RepID=A0AAP0Q6Q2_9MAGN